MTAIHHGTQTLRGLVNIMTEFKVYSKMILLQKQVVHIKVVMLGMVSLPMSVIKL